MPIYSTYEQASDRLTWAHSRLSAGNRELAGTAVRYTLGLIRLKSDLRSPLSAYKSEIEAAVKIIASDWTMAVADPAQRAILEKRIREDLKGLMKETTKEITQLLLRDVMELTPFWNDTAETKTFKKLLMEELITEVKKTETQALEEIDTRNATYYANSTSSDFIFKSGPAMRQLGEFATHTHWSFTKCSDDRRKPDYEACKYW